MLMFFMPGSIQSHFTLHSKKRSIAETEIVGTRKNRVSALIFNKKEKLK